MFYNITIASVSAFDLRKEHEHFSDCAHFKGEFLIIVCLIKHRCLQTLHGNSKAVP